jgi:hypothetical protein
MRGNYVGVDAAGNAALGNGGFGLRGYGETDCEIGGPAAADGNVIAGNVRSVSFELGATGNVMRNNILGLNAAATADLTDTGTGIELGSPGNTSSGRRAPATSSPASLTSGIVLGRRDRLETSSRATGSAPVRRSRRLRQRPVGDLRHRRARQQDRRHGGPAKAMSSPTTASSVFGSSTASATRSRATRSSATRCSASTSAIRGSRPTTVATVTAAATGVRTIHLIASAPL